MQNVGRLSVPYQDHKSTVRKRQFLWGPRWSKASAFHQGGTVTGGCYSPVEAVSWPNRQTGVQEKSLDPVAIASREKAGMRGVSLVPVLLLGLLPAILGLIGPSGVAYASSTVVRGSGLPLPRFVSLRADEVNMRTGPGTQYPVEWIYMRRGYPVEVIAEFDAWRRIRDWEGSEGWVHQTMLTGRRTFVVFSQQRFLRVQPADDAPTVAGLGPGVVGDLLQCPTNTVQYCRVEVRNYIGWLKRDDFWGVERDEFF